MLLAHAGRPDHSPWEWHLHPDVLAVVGLMILGYWLLFAYVGPRAAADGEAVVSRRQLRCLGAAIGGFWIMSDWPVHDLSEGYLYSVHMVQHLVYTLVLPPLFMWGTPAWTWRWLLRPVMPLFRFLVRPIPALIVFNGIVALTHATGFVTAAVESGAAHLAQHILLVAASFFMWWPVLSPLPEIRPMPPLAQMVYLFLQSLLPTIPASFLALANEPVYEVYERFPRLLGMTAAQDQQLAGAIMKVAGGLILWAFIVVIFFRWAAADQREAALLRRATLQGSPQVDGRIEIDVAAGMERAEV